ncbi:hypothetical protein GTW51_03365 [Aurantimonas aggregata]|uniref:Flagellar hook-length control protein-like C-terminal domain-containing protein n=1 Tax=Aurantimonas aggregata TaxID=2047720 RepID=A0A6L9MD52_9HYPH|nr:flagellar hook-length control protein FliK [Aurantimonas aggregata]NDV85735.1 hypothetical protein [Aurantimonas aggregata]
MTAVPKQIDVVSQPAARRAAARDERSGGGEGFAVALGAREDRQPATTVGDAAADAASTGRGPADGDSNAALASISPSEMTPPLEGRDGAPADPRPEGLAAILAAFEAGPRHSAAAAGPTGEKAMATPAGSIPDTINPTARPVADLADGPREISAPRDPFAGLPDSMPDDARTDLFRRLDATAAAVFDGDAAPLRFAARGHGAPGNQVRADFVSMRTDFAPAGRGDDRGAVAATFAARNGALGRLVADDAAQPSAASIDAADDAVAGVRAGATQDGSRKVANAGATATVDALSPGVRPGSVRDEAKGGDAATERHPATKTESSTVFPEPAASAGPSAPGTIATVPPMRQVASALGSAFGEFRAAPDSAETTGNLRLRAGGAALKTVQIQLQPAHFGKVDVTLKLIDGQLAIQLMASEPETVMRLKDDTEGLKSLLSQSGFAVDDAAISIGLRDPGQARATSPGFADGTPHGASADGGAPNGDASQNPSGGQRGAAGQGGASGDGQGTRITADAQTARSDLDRSVYL